MIKLTETTSQDVEQIREWVAADPWHCNDLLCQHPELMITGYGLLCFCVQDDEGPLFYVKLTEDGELIRCAVQFAPESEVSRKRTAQGLAEVGIPAMKMYAEQTGYKGLIFESENSELTAFTKKLGFDAVGGNQFVMAFERQQDV